jgi:hypothetical protein
MAQDASVHEQAGTFMSHAHSDAGGRFSSVGAATVIGSTAVPQYPQASTPFQCDPVPNEPPLGFDNPALEPSMSACPEAQAGEPAERAPSPDPLADVERGNIGSLLSSRRQYRRI